jgi:hypothetical protein
MGRFRVFTVKIARSDPNQRDVNSNAVESDTDLGKKVGVWLI